MENNKLNMDWNSEDTKSEDSQSSDKTIKKVTAKNKNLTPEQMEIILKEYEDNDEYEDVEPFIIKSTRKGGGRFYIIRSILLEDASKIDDMFAVFHEEELTIETNKAKNKWMADNKIQEDAITVEKREEMNAHVDSYLNKIANKLLTRVNDKVINILGVVFPDNHKNKIMSNRIAIGDVQALAMSIQVLSGWSGVSNDIDVFRETEFNNETDLEELEDSIYKT